MMNARQGKLWFFLFALFMILTVNTASANKTSVSIECPNQAAKGNEITITLSVSHSGNSFFHYTNWVYLKINGKEVKRWDISRTNRPAAAAFTESFTLVVEEPLEIEAEGNCNIHGSKGIAKASVTLQE